ncbi:MULTISPECIES: hypothetical protein [Streptomyces]|uniref:Uncharacterized protein n=1 Tax=Streptomyces triticiradicis TaxID=2651189 RepID=A0A7J5D8K4_9ACTN|nr:hypothetical protein [Streptomyces triticiradicis]KAB1982860.1 hypothetical protein F8144_30160 [Streptomyces triticiradicis]
MDLVTSPWESAARVDQIGELASKGDLAGLSRALLLAKDSWHEGFGVTTVLRGLPEADRIALARSFAEHAVTTPADGEVGDRGLVLLAAVSRDIVDADWCEAWEALLTEMADQFWSCGISDELWTCSQALLDAGRHVPEPVVALLRRSALEHAWPTECVTPVLDRLRGPVLNPGEPWADALLTDLPSLGEPWPGVIGHALLAPVARPTHAWDRRALALTAPIGTEEIRRAVTPWLDLAADGGGRWDGGYDPYNLPALAGLTWLLSLLPPHPASIRTLGDLVERAPVRTPLTGTAVRALARVPQQAGRSELERLSGRVRHKVTQRQIRKALDA